MLQYLSRIFVTTQPLLRWRATTTTNLAMLHVKYYNCTLVEVCLHILNMMNESKDPKDHQVAKKLLKAISLYFVSKHITKSMLGDTYDISKYLLLSDFESNY